MRSKIFVIVVFCSLLACVSCKKDEPAQKEYYLVVYNETFDNIFVSFYNKNKKVASRYQFDNQIDKSKYDSLWLGVARDNLFIYKETDSFNIYLPQSIYMLAADSIFGEFSSDMIINGKTVERYFKTFHVTDKMFQLNND